MSAVFGRQAMQHHDNVLNGLIQFQRADDYGEVARSVANGMSGVMRSGNSLDARVLQIANQIAKQQQTQLTDSQRSACLLYTSPSPRDRTRSRMPSSA